MRRKRNRRKEKVIENRDTNLALRLLCPVVAMKVNWADRKRRERVEPDERKRDMFPEPEEERRLKFKKINK